MKAAGSLTRFTATRHFSFALAAALLSAAMLPAATAQAPYLLPYVVQSLAGGAATQTVGSACTGAPAYIAGDTSGDGCPASSGSVLVGAGLDVHDVAVDQKGNIYFIDNGTGGLVRRIDAQSGVVTVVAGTLGGQTTCATTIDKFGDGCVASDGVANAAGGASAPSKLRGLAVARNGDIYLADYGGYLIHKISASTGVMSLVAGSLATGSRASGIGGVKGYSGDGSFAFNLNASPPNGAAVNAPRGVGVDLAGDVYIADTGNNVVRLVYNGGSTAASLIGASKGNPTATLGYIYTIAGASTAGSAGDGGPAASASFSAPEDVQPDPLGNVFIADQANSRVRVIYEGGAAVASMISKTNSGITPVVGNIYTVMGMAANVTAPTTTNYGPVLATSVSIGGPRKLVIDAHDNLFVADNGNNVIWFLEAATGQMRVIAGQLGVATAGSYCAAKTDAFGDGCPGVQATINGGSNIGVGIDGFGQLYFTDSINARIRTVTTGQFFPAVATAASVTQTLEVHFNAGDPPASSNPFTLTGSKAFTLGSPSCTTRSDQTTDCLVSITFSPLAPGSDSAALTVVSTANAKATFGLSGNGLAASLGYDPGNASALSTTLTNPFSATQDVLGNTYIADTGNNRLVKVDTGGTSTILAGGSAAGYTGDGGAAKSATLNAPKAVAVTRDGSIYIADSGNNVVRVINPLTGVISTVAGGAGSKCAQPNDTLNNGCPGTAATLSMPSGLAADALGNVYIADTGNNVVRELSSTGYLSLAAGPGVLVCPAKTGDTLGNSCQATASSVVLSGPTGLAVDAAGNLYIADTGNSEIREVLTSSAGNTVFSSIIVRAGRGTPGTSGNGGIATSAQLTGPTGVAVDAAGNLYIADTGNNAIRLVNGAGTISTVAGTLGAAAAAGSLPGSAFGVLLNAPAGVAVNGAGYLTIVDSANNRVLNDDRGSLAYNFGRTSPNSSSPTLTITETVTGSAQVAQPAPLFTTTGAASAFSLTPAASSGCGSTTASSTPLAIGSSCQLTAQFNPTAIGTFTATYTGTATNASGTALANPYKPFLQLTGTGFVQTPTSATTVVTSPAPPALPQFAAPFTVTTTVTPTTCSTVAPGCIATGTVQFFADNTSVGTPVNLNANGAATQQISGLTVGMHSITAVYSGDDFYASSTAAVLSVSVAQGATTTTLSASDTNPVQFTPLTLTATVKATSADIPTGRVMFLLNGKPLPGSPATLSPTTGVANLVDAGNSFGLNPGRYSVTAVYSGDANYAASSSAAFTLTVASQPQSFTETISFTAAGTAQGSTAIDTVSITPTNTLNDTITFACSGLPANSVCTFSPTNIIVSPVTGVAPTQMTQMTLWTSVPPGVIPGSKTASLSLPALRTSSRQTALAAVLGWPALLLTCGGLLANRRRLRGARLLAMLLVVGALAGASSMLTGCSTGIGQTGTPTPTGSYVVTVTATGTNSKLVSSKVLTFSVGAGIAGQQ